MKQLFKGIVPLILMLLVSNSGTATAQEKDQLVFPDITQAASLVNQNQFSTEVIEEVEVLAAPTETLVTSGNGLWYMNMKTNEASDGSITRSYQVTKNGNGEIISKIEQVDKQVVVEPTATTIQEGAQVQVGATFTPRFTRYGADCAGCTRRGDGTSAAASGIQVTTTAVRQLDGSWKSGITYGGRYLFASSSDLPMCTLISVSNHNYSGMGITQGQPIYGFIGDRGVGANHLDLFVGSEYALNKVAVASSTTPVVTITGFGTWTGNGCQF